MYFSFYSFYKYLVLGYYWSYFTYYFNFDWTFGSKTMLLREKEEN